MSPISGEGSSAHPSRLLPSVPRPGGWIPCGPSRTTCRPVPAWPSPVIITQITTLFLDEDLRIQRFTESARDLVALRDSNVGRPIDDLRFKLQGQDLSDDGEQVLRSLVPKEVKVQTKAEQWYLLRIQPYRTTQNVIQDLVCTFQDIQSASRNDSSEIFSGSFVNTVREPLLVLDAQLRVTAANDGFYRYFSHAPEAMEVAGPAEGDKEPGHGE